MKYPDQYVQGFMDCLASEKKGVFVRHLFVDLNDGNWSDAAMFSQCAYIFAQMHDEGYRHYSIHEYQGHLWISLSYAQWWESCRLNKSTVRAVIRRIHDRGLFFVQKTREGNSPRILIRLNYPEFSARLQAEEAKKHVIESVTSCDRISHVTRSNQSLGGDRISHLEVIESVTSCDRISHVSISKDSLEDLDQKKERSPERGREEVFEGEVISEGLVSESDPTRSDFVVQQPKDSGSDLEILREDQIAAAPKISREAAQRADNLQEAQLRRKGIDPIDYNRFRAIYAPYVNGVTKYGFGSDEYAHREWLNLQRNGWVADEDFWRGLDLESAWGLELYRKTKTSIPGVPGGAAFLSSRRWEQAIERNVVSEKLKSVDLEMHVEKPKELRLSDSISKMNEVANRVIDRILARDQETQLLEASHDF